MNKIAKKSERFHNKVFWKINKNNIKVENKKKILKHINQNRISTCLVLVNKQKGEWIFILFIPGLLVSRIANKVLF